MKKRDPSAEVGIDVIGDIHGYADHLKALLEQMGYRKTKGAYRHEARTVIFVGDLIDRGPKQVEVYRLVRDMCEAGSAQCVLGNHEFNAIGFTTPHPETGAPLREHNSRNVEQHEAFLNQVKKEREPNLYEEIIDWFRILPVWIDRDDLRVVHACWHEDSRQTLSSYVDDKGRFTTEGLMTALTRGTEAYDAVDILLKGPEVRLPNGLTFRDPQGSVRRKARVKWWDHGATTYRTALIVSPDVVDKLPDSELQDQDRRFAYLDSKPLFFGHYWLDEELHVKHESAVCLDYSIAKDGALVAYRWSGETKLQSDNLHAVPKPTVGDRTWPAQPYQSSSVGGSAVG
jgi:hypothetical protein